MVREWCEMQGLQPPDLSFDLAAGSPFSYRCLACSRCCHDKVILIGPYDILRLARHLGLSTTDFIARHSSSGGTVLRFAGGEVQRCVFLSQAGCQVHADRPLACRLYPLALHVDEHGVQTFSRLPGHPQSAGLFGCEGTVADFLREQGVAPYLEAAARYRGVFQRMLACLARMDDRELDRLPDRQAEIVSQQGQGPASRWLDVDQIVSEHCARLGRQVPVDIDETIRLHIEAIEHWLDSLEGPPGRTKGSTVEAGIESPALARP
jgi:Fe-S-cluster containining protein